MSFSADPHVRGFVGLFLGVGFPLVSLWLYEFIRVRQLRLDQQHHRRLYRHAVTVCVN